MKFTVFSKRTIVSAPECLAEPTLRHTTLFREGQHIEICVLRGEDQKVETAFQQVKSRSDLLIVELFSGNVGLPESSVNTWLYKKFAQLSANTVAVPSH